MIAVTLVKETTADITVGLNLVCTLYFQYIVLHRVGVKNIEAYWFFPQQYILYIFKMI